MSQGSSLNDWIRETAAAQMRAEAAHVEARLMAGENRVERPYGVNGLTVVYEVPRWRERPLRRLRVEWMRRRGSRA